MVSGLLGTHSGNSYFGSGSGCTSTAGKVGLSQPDSVRSDPTRVRLAGLTYEKARYYEDGRAARPDSPAPVRRKQPRRRLEREELEHPAPKPGSHLRPEGVDVQDPRSSASVGIGPDAHHRDHLHRRILVGGIRVQLLALERTSLGSGPIRRGLDVMHELDSELLVGPGHQLAEYAIDAHECRRSMPSYATWVVGVVGMSEGIRLPSRWAREHRVR